MLSELLGVRTTLRCKLVWARLRRRAALSVAFSEMARERAESRYYRRASRIEDKLWRLDPPDRSSARR